MIPGIDLGDQTSASQEHLFLYHLSDHYPSTLVTAGLFVFEVLSFQRSEFGNSLVNIKHLILVLGLKVFRVCSLILHSISIWLCS